MLVLFSFSAGTATGMVPFLAWTLEAHGSFPPPPPVSLKPLFPFLSLPLPVTAGLLDFDVG